MIKGHPIIEYQFYSRKPFNSRESGTQFFEIIDAFPEFEPYILDSNDPPRKKYNKQNRLDVQALLNQYQQ